MGKIKLSDVIDINYLQTLQDSFADATGMASISIDLDGNVTQPSNFHDFCMKHTRNCSEGLRRCLECDKRGGEESEATGRPSVYFCHAGLIDFAVPIIVDGEHIGSVIGGQVLSEKPDEEKFIKIASELGINPDEYVNAVKKIPILPERQIRSAANLLGIMVNKLCDQANSNYRFKKDRDEIKKCITSINSTLKEFYNTSETLNTSQSELTAEIQNITKLLKEINNVAKLVSSLADETQMISFNASIEAARAGEQGKSFTIIAGEIRNLSEQSKETVANIQNFTANIGSSIKRTGTHNKDCMSAIVNEIDGLKSIENDVNRIIELLDKQLSQH